MNRELVNQQLRTLLAQYQQQGRSDLAAQIQQYIQSDWATPVADPQLALTIKDILTAGGFVYGTPAGQQQGTATSTTNLGAGIVDEFGGQLTGPGAGQSQRPTEAGINYQVNQQRKAAGLPPQAATPGAPPVAGAGGGAGSGTLPFAQNAILADEDQGAETMLQLLMDRIGIDLGNPGLYGGVIAKQINEYLPYFRSLLGLQGNTNVGNVNTLYTGGLDQLAQMIGSNTFYSGLQDYAKQTQPTMMAGLSGPGGIRDVGKQQEYLNALLTLSTAGQNPLLRQSAADDATRAWLGYRRANYDNPLSGTGGATSYIDWLTQQSNPQYGSVLNLLGGGR